MHLLHPKERIVVIVFLLSVVVIAIFLSFKESNRNSNTQISDKTATNSVNTLEKKSLKVGEKIIEVETADSQQELVTGLSYRNSLETNSGMYFVLEKKQIASFWMLGMKFPLDIIWIDDGVIVGVEENAPVPTMEDIPSFTSPQPVTNVLEVNAGFFQTNNLKIGDKIAFP